MHIVIVFVIFILCPLGDVINKLPLWMNMCVHVALCWTGILACISASLPVFASCFHLNPDQDKAVTEDGWMNEWMT